MQAEQASRILSALEIKPSGQQAAWDVLEDAYMTLLSRIPDALATALLEYVHYGHGKWRPTPDEILTWYRRVTGTDEVSASDVQAEILRAMERHGLYGLPDPENPRVHLPGTPPLSKEAKETVDRLGGWERVCALPETAWRIEVSKQAASVIEYQRLEKERRRVQALPGMLRLIGGGEAE